MEPWDDLVAAALVGTERRPWQPAPTGGALGDLVARIGHDDPEGALLGAAGVGSLHRRAGRLAPVDRRPAPGPAPIDDLPSVSRRVGRRLGAMLAGQHRDVLPEWLSLVAAAGRRAPDERLPALLEHGRHHHHLRDPILAVVGGRGRWLAAQNADWEWAAEIRDVEHTWQTGSRERRLALLRALRRETPDRARELLTATWAEEEPVDRAALLGTFADGLGMDDEPFLEDALDDRRKEVREMAVGLLTRLPGSRLVQRTVERVRPLLTFVPTEKGSLLALARGKPARIDVTLPSECEAGMIRDGVSRKAPAGQELGDRAWWLFQMLHVVAPRFWESRWAASPATLLEAAARSEWSAPLLRGWTRAAQQHRDLDWAEAILARDPHRGELVELFPPPRRDRMLTSILAAGGSLPADSPHWGIIHAAKQPWGMELGRFVLGQIRKLVAESRAGTIWQLHGVLTAFAHNAPISLLDEAHRAWPDRSDSPWRSAINELLDTLRFRAEMHKEIAE